MISKVFKDFFDKWQSVSPDGRPFAPLPWEAEEVLLSGRRAPRLPVYGISLGRTLLGCALVVVFSYAVRAPLSAGVAATFLALGLAAYKDSWLQSGALKVRCRQSTVKVHEFDKFQLVFAVKNTTGSILSQCILIFRFPGAVSHSQIISLGELGPYASREVAVQFVADGGMGVYQLEPVRVVTCDRFGLIPRCVQHEEHILIDVLPEMASMPEIKIKTAGMTSHSGSIEAKITGDSTSFLGLDFIGAATVSSGLIGKKVSECGIW